MSPDRDDGRRVRPLGVVEEPAEPGAVRRVAARELVAADGPGGRRVGTEPGEQALFAPGRFKISKSVRAEVQRTFSRNGRSCPWTTAGPPSVRPGRSKKMRRTSSSRVARA